LSWRVRPDVATWQSFEESSSIEDHGLKSGAGSQDLQPSGETNVMTTANIANRLVEMCREGKYMEAIEELYADDVVSLEPVDHGPTIPARVEGKDAVRAKNIAWSENSENHGIRVDGPFIGTDQFAVRFHIDSTPKATGRRVQVTEMALYTVRDGKIVMEEFYYAPVQ
jgi:ketosteroid isomerase-like protein